MNGDGRREQHAQVPASWLDVPLSLTAYRVGIAVATKYRPGEPGSSYMSVGTIAEKARLTERNVYKGLRELREHRLIGVDPPRPGRKSNAYTILPASPPPLSESDSLSTTPRTSALSESDISTLLESDRGTLLESDSQSYPLSDPVSKASPTVKGNDALASSPLASVVDAKHDGATTTQLALGVSPAPPVTKERRAKKKRGRTQDFATFKTAVAARVEAIDGEQIRYLKTRPRWDVAAHFAMQFMGRKVDSVEKARDVAVGLWPRILNVTQEPKHAHFADVTVGEFFRIGRKIHEALDGQDWTTPWNVIGWGTQIPGEPEPEPAPRSFLDVKRAELGDGYDAWANERRDRITAANAEQDRGAAETAALVANLSARDGDETADEADANDALPLPGHPVWVREIADFERRLETVSLAFLATERADRKRLGALHAVLYDPAGYKDDERDIAMRTADRYAVELEPFCRTLRELGDRSVTVSEYCAVAGELLDRDGAGSRVSVALVAGEIVARARAKAATLDETVPA